MGNWVGYAGESIYLVPPPVLLERALPDSGEAVSASEYNFEEGGIYTAEAVRRMEKYAQAPRSIQGITAELSRRNNFEYQAGTPLLAGQLFADLPDAPTLGIIEVFEWVWSWVETYGKICSIVVGTALLIKAFSWALGVIIRLTSPRLFGMGWCMHTLSAFVPALRERARDRFQAGQEDTDYAQCCFGLGNSARAKGYELPPSYGSPVADRMDEALREKLLSPVKAGESGDDLGAQDLDPITAEVMLRRFVFLTQHRQDILQPGGQKKRRAPRPPDDPPGGGSGTQN